jgi:lycopene cyclase domain-containing protein
MIYREFIGYFLAPCVMAAVAGVFARARYRPEGFPLARAVKGLAALASVAVVYTTPWDCWLIQNEVWWYPPGSVLATVFDVPVEEYLFMVCTSVLTGCWRLIIAMSRQHRAEPITGSSCRKISLRFWLAVIGFGGVLVGLSEKSLYLGSMMVCFGVPLALQAGLGADLLRSSRKVRSAGLALTPLLWIADAVAINAGAWELSRVHTIGVRVWVLPFEEALFFLLVNVLVVNTVVLVTHPGTAGRIRRVARLPQAAIPDEPVPVSERGV